MFFTRQKSTLIEPELCRYLVEGVLNDLKRRGATRIETLDTIIEDVFFPPAQNDQRVADAGGLIKSSTPRLL